MYTQTASTLDIPVMQYALFLLYIILFSNHLLIFVRSVDEVSPERRVQLINQLGSWSFEPYKLPDEEAIVCTEIIFESLLRIEGIETKLSIGMDRIRPFLRQLRAIYRTQNHYHNFIHAIDVLQSTALFLRNAGVVPPISIVLEEGKLWKRHSSKKKRCSNAKKLDPGLLRSLTLADLLALYLAAIGHDVGHPGFSNAFLVRVYVDFWKRSLALINCRKTPRLLYLSSTMIVLR